MSVMEKKLVIGLPAGSLASASRGGNLVSLLDQAGFKTKGYQDGGPSSFPAVSCFFGWDGRPQEFGCQLGLAELDVAIAGDDWIRERQLELGYEYGQTIELERLLPLKRGQVRLVGIVDSSDSHADLESFLRDHFSGKRLLVIATEMPYTALDWILSAMKKGGFDASLMKHSVQKYKTPPKIGEGVLIYETWGKTEAKIKNLGADLGLEITQSGSALASYGLRVLETVFESQSSIWIRPGLLRDGEKKELLEMFLMNLQGALNAESEVLLVFNVPTASCAGVEAYLRENNLFGDEPTVNRGKDYSEYSVQIDASDPALPLAMVRYRLAVLGARHIDTIPVLSSIPGRFFKEG
jgi:ATP phosphoribosyltransferase